MSATIRDNARTIWCRLESLRHQYGSKNRAAIKRHGIRSGIRDVRIERTRGSLMIRAAQPRTLDTVVRRPSAPIIGCGSPTVGLALFDCCQRVLACSSRLTSVAGDFMSDGSEGAPRSFWRWSTSKEISEPKLLNDLPPFMSKPLAFRIFHDALRRRSSLEPRWGCAA